MKKYLAQKENLEKQGWKVYQKTGNNVFFAKAGISGLVVEVDNSNGDAILNSSAPKEFEKEHKPTLLELK